MNNEQEKVKQRLFYRDYVEAWRDMQIQEALWKVLFVMKWSLGVLVLFLEGVIRLSISCSCSHFWPVFAVCLVVYLNKHNIDNDVLSLSWILLSHFCVDVLLICITHNRYQPPLKSTLFQLQVYANIDSCKMLPGCLFTSFLD